MKLSPEAATVIVESAGLGIQLDVDGEDLKYSPKSAMPESLLARLRSCKAELVRALSGASSPLRCSDADRHRPEAVFPRRNGAASPLARRQSAQAAASDPDVIRGGGSGWFRKPDLYRRPDGGWETFVERSERCRNERGGLPSGASRRVEPEDPAPF